MATTPKYDNDYVTLGYLNKTLGAESEETENKINKIPKNYNSPPLPPYYENSLLMLDGQIYKCIKSRLVGSFTMSDWKIVVSTDELDEWIKTIYDVNKLEYVDQEDGVIETFYQEEDPSVDWTTDIEKNNHVSDLWTTDTLTCYQYEKKATNPVSYGWKKIGVPSTLFDIFDGYKRIFLEQPINYSKDDLWFGETTKIALESSEEFVESHWENRDDFIESSVIEQEEYHKIYLLPKITEINRQSISEIKKAIDEITLTVSQTYTTKTEVEEYIDDVKTGVAEEYTTKEEFNAQLSLTSTQIKAVVEKNIQQDGNIEMLNQKYERDITLTKEISGNPIIIEDAGAYPLEKLTVYGNSKQETREGYNLFNLYKFKGNAIGNSTTIKGVTFTIQSDGGIRAVGTATANADYYIAGSWSSTTVIDTYAAGTYTLKPIADNSTMKGRFYAIGNSTVKIGQNLNLKGSKTFTEDTDITAYMLRIFTGQTVDTVVYPMIYLGDDDKPYEMYGKSPNPDYPSEIETIKGYENLLNNIMQSQNLNGVNFLVNDDKSIIINGTATVRTEPDIWNNSDGEVLILKKGVTYYNKTDVPIYILADTYYVIKANSNYTPTIDLEVSRVYIRVESNTTVERTIYPMLTTEKNSVNYVPYGRRYLVNNIKNANLLSFESVKNTAKAYGMTVEKEKDIITFDGTSPWLYTVASSSDLKFKSGLYTFYIIPESGEWTSGWIGISGVDKNNLQVTYQQYSFGTTKGTRIYTEDEISKITRFNLYATQGAVFNNFKFKVQLKSIDDDIYVSPKENIINFDLQGNELCALGDIQDELDMTTGVLTKRIGKLILDGSENWNRESTWGNQSAFYNGSLAGKWNPKSVSGYSTKANLKSTHFDVLQPENIANSICSKIGQGAGTTLFISIDGITTISDLQSWLTENPVTIYYELAEPEIIQLEPTKIELFEGYNVISVLDDLALDIDARYLTDSKMNAQYATKSELNIAESGINAKLDVLQQSDDYQEEKIRELNVGIDGVSISITDIQKNIDLQQNNISDINSNINDTNSEINDLKNELANVSETIKQMNYDFGTDELNINSVNDPVNTGISNKGVIVRSYETIKTVVNDHGLGTDDLIVTNTAQIGYLKFMKSTDSKGNLVTDIHHLVSNIQDVSDLVGDN